MLNDAILADYCATFVGYGQWKAPVWFIGIEEAGGHNEFTLAKHFDTWHVRGRRDLEDAPAFYPNSGNHAWHGGCATLQPTWAQLIRMLLFAQNKPVSPRHLLDYQRSRLGAQDGETCLLELFPLPSPSVATWNYADWSELCWLRNREAYQHKMLDQRITLLRQRIDSHRPPVVVFYGDGQLKHWRRIMGDGAYPRPLPQKLISHERDDVAFFVTKHPAHPDLQATSDEYFQEIGHYFRINCPDRFA